MKILVITSSSHHPGTSEILAQQFIKGASEHDNQIVHFDAASNQVTPMSVNSDNQPLKGNSTDDEIVAQLIQAELLVLVTPLYYYGMSAQLKSVIDRMYEVNRKLQGHKQSILLASAYGNKSAFDALVAHYQSIYTYMCWRNRGMVLAENSHTVDQLNQTNFPNDAYQLGLSIRN